MTPARIGLFGGTFDPVHFGHLRPAIELAEHFALDMLYLLPNHQPAHRGPTGASSAQRIDMLRLAVADVSRLEVDTREALRGGPSYTIDTLEAMRSEFPDATFLFFLGMDAFAGFDSWRRWQDILGIANLVVIDRPGASLSSFSADLLQQQTTFPGGSIKAAMDSGAANSANAESNASRHSSDASHNAVIPAGIIECVDVTQLEISATAVRQAAAAGRSLRFLLPESVRQYIDQHKLYLEKPS